jgi:integrase
MRSAFPHCYRSKDRHGRERWLLRVPGRKAVTIKGRYGSPEFAENYRTALAPVGKTGIGVPKQGSISALARAYLASAHFASLAEETRRHRRSAIEPFAVKFGDFPVGGKDGLHSKHVRKIIEGTPGRARNLLGAISALMTYAVDMGWRDDNPCRGVKRPKLSKDGWHSWTDEEISIYRTRHPNGTMARLALELALCSIQRRSDLVRLGRQHVRDGLLTVTQQKTGNPAYVEIGADLETAFMPSQHLTFLVTSAGAPFTPSGLTHYFRLRCKEAGLSGCPLHGLRKAGARLAVEARCDITEVAAIGGWKSVRELQRYIEDYNRQQAARRAGEKMRTFTRTQRDQSRTRAKNA